MRALLLALAPSVSLSLAGAEAEQRPPIFAPVVEPEAPVRSSAPLRVPLSDRVRQSMSEQILATARAFEPPAAAANATELTRTDSGALLMPRFVVQSRLPDSKEVEPPKLTLGQFTRVERVDRQRNAFSATLASFLDGKASLHLNVVNAAGFGVDHNVDFTRVELAFRFRF